MTIERIEFAAKVSREGRRITGYVQLAGSRTFRNGEWWEVDPAAVVKADASDVIAAWEHDPFKVLASAGNGTLRIERTDQGIRYETDDLPDTTYANDALALLDGGYVTGSSFAIEGIKSSFSTDPDGTRVRRITSIKRLVDVSPTRTPAFADSAAAAFSNEEYRSMTDPIEPAETSEDAPAKVQFTAPPKSGKDKWVEFARPLSTETIENALDQIMAETKGNLTGDKADQYEGFSEVLQERHRDEAEMKARIERAKFRHDAIRGLLKPAPATDVFASDDYFHAFSAYLRSGDPRSMEQFAQAIAGDGTQGGYTVPESFLTRITETMKAYGGIQAVADTITTADGRDLPWPTNDDTSNSAAIATEGSAVASGGADLVFGEVRLGAYTYDATGTGNVPLLVSKELIQDSAFDLEAFVARKLGERLGRKMAADFATADGSSKPKGLLAKSADTMTATTMLAAVQEHHFQVNQAYRDSGNCRWIMGDTTLTKVYASVDKNGRPLFIPVSDSSGAGRPAGFLLGYPVTLDQGSGDKVAFGDIRSGFIIRYVRGVTIDVDPYTNIKSRQIAYHAWARADSDVQDSAAYSVSDYSGVSADTAA